MQISNLQIFLKNRFIKGTGKKGEYEIVPYTHYIARKLDLPLLPEPPNSEDIEPKVLEGLRPYQQEDLKRMVNRKSSANFSEPRTGKTPTALRWAVAKGLKKILVVAPASALYQWRGEVLKWYGGRAEVLKSSLKETQKKELLLKWGSEINVLIVSYDSLKVIHRQGKELGLLPLVKAQKDIDGIIVDEAHRIRNHKIPRAKAIFALKNIPNKHVLTGTPAHGRLKDVFSILHFLYPTIFTGYWRFIDYYFEQRTVYYPHEHVEIGDLLNLSELPEFLDRIGVQHKRKEVMKWLPDKDYVQIKLPLTDLQQKYIIQMEEEFEVGEINAQNVLSQLMYIRQICQDPEILGLKGKSPKLEWLQEYLEDYPDTPIIIFSNFTRFLKKISEKLGINNLIIGETTSKRREELRTSFQEGKINVLLINIQAGKEALTLDRAEVAIFLDTFPPYGDIDQAENRFTATTPELKEKPHTIIQLMMDNSYDEVLFDLVAQRASETEIINSYRQHLERRGKP